MTLSVTKSKRSFPWRGFWKDNTLTWTDNRPSLECSSPGMGGWANAVLQVLGAWGSATWRFRARDHTGRVASNQPFGLNCCGSSHSAHYDFEYRKHSEDLMLVASLHDDKISEREKLTLYIDGSRLSESGPTPRRSALRRVGTWPRRKSFPL